MISGSVKIDNIYQSLIRKGLITEQNSLTKMGKQLLVFLNTVESTKITKFKPSTVEFDSFWKAFPGTDTFMYKGKQFNGSRSLRAAKEQCRVKFNVILNEGDHTAAEIIAALDYDVLQKKEKSIDSGVNKLSFLQNSLTYLNQRSFEPFIELIKEGIVIAEKVRGETEI